MFSLTAYSSTTRCRSSPILDHEESAIGISWYSDLFSAEGSGGEVLVIRRIARIVFHDWSPVVVGDIHSVGTAALTTAKRIIPSFLNRDRRPGV